MIKRVPSFFPILSLCVATIVAAALLSACGGATSPVAPLPQGGNAMPQGTQDTIALTAAEIKATSTYTNVRYHINLLNPPGAVHTMGVVFPLDMTKGTGTVLKATTQNDIFVNTTSAAVGTPTIFQANLNLNTTFLSVLNQYDGVTSTGKFPVGTSFSATVPTFSNMISQGDLFNVIHAAAKTGGAGYGHEYNVFLKSGLDTCIDFGPCYSPDNPPTWVFCAYHGSLTYSDIGHVIYSIMPYQDVPGCGDNGTRRLAQPGADRQHGDHVVA